MKAQKVKNIEVEIKVEGACCNEPNIEPEYCYSFFPAGATTFIGPVQELKKMSIEDLIKAVKEDIEAVKTPYEGDDGIHYCWPSWIDAVVYQNGKDVRLFRITLFDKDEQEWQWEFERAIKKVLVWYGQ